MTTTRTPPPSPWRDAVHAAALFAVDPVGVGGLVVHSRAGPVRDRWLALLKSYLPAAGSVVRMPVHIGQGRLFGGLDLNATLQTGRPVVDVGFLAANSGNTLVLGSAERVPPLTVAGIATAMDTGEIVTERDGISARHPAAFSLVAFDEAASPDEGISASLRDRLPFRIFLDEVPLRQTEAPAPSAAAITAARTAAAAVPATDEAIRTLCVAARTLGISSMRAPMTALRLAQISAALGGRSTIESDDLILAGRLALAPSAATAPPPETPPASESGSGDSADLPDAPAKGEAPSHNSTSEQEGSRREAETVIESLEETVQAAVNATLPPDVLARLASASVNRSSRGSAGRAASFRNSTGHGRPVGTRRGDPRRDGRLNILATLRAAAPWQKIRARELLSSADGTPMPARKIVRPSDFRVTRYKQRTNSTTIFVVDASGSAALHRLAEAKGAVELLLAESYVRRDSVALISFRGTTAEVQLAPTRSLARAKKRLSTLPGGGGTPLAAGIAAAVDLADPVRRRGDIPAIVLLTDGRANIGLDGTPGRPAGEEDAMVMARTLGHQGFDTLLIDIASTTRPFARILAETMGALYLPLPNGDAAAISRSIQSLSR